MYGVGRMLIVAGALIALAGVCVLIAGKLNLPLGRLPGDISWHGKNSSFYFPIATCVVLSVLLSLVFYIIGRIHR